MKVICRKGTPPNLEAFQISWQSRLLLQKYQFNYVKTDNSAVQIKDRWLNLIQFTLIFKVPNHINSHLKVFYIIK